MVFVKLNAITSQERNQVISQVKSAISKQQGWIVDHTLLSNLAATIVFEISSHRLSAFQKDMEYSGLIIECDDTLREGPPQAVRAILSLTFVHNEPDLKRDVPHFG